MKKEIKYDDYFILSQNISKQIVRNLCVDKDAVENSLIQLIFLSKYRVKHLKIKIFEYKLTL